MWCSCSLNSVPPKCNNARDWLHQTCCIEHTSSKISLAGSRASVRSDCVQWCSNVLNFSDVSQATHLKPLLGSLLNDHVLMNPNIQLFVTESAHLWRSILPACLAVRMPLVLHNRVHRQIVGQRRAIDRFCKQNIKFLRSFGFPPYWSY